MKGLKQLTEDEVHPIIQNQFSFPLHIALPFLKVVSPVVQYYRSFKLRRLKRRDILSYIRI